MATPPRSAPATSPRGSFRVKQSYPGIATFKSFTCQGQLYETREFPEHAIGDGLWIIDKMNGDLSHVGVCPPGHPEGACPFDQQRIRKLELVKPTPR